MGVHMINNLSASDPVGMSFWLISMAMVAATVFFLIERDRVSGKWKTSLTVAGLVTLIAAVHYFYMRDVWVATGETPTVYRYIDWLLTVPLLIIEFYLILSAITKVPAGVFWRLLAGSLIMLFAGFAGEVNPAYVVSGFVVGMLGWIGSCMKSLWVKRARSTLPVAMPLLRKLTVPCVCWLLLVGRSTQSVMCLVTLWVLPTQIC